MLTSGYFLPQIYPSSRPGRLWAKLEGPDFKRYTEYFKPEDP